jgi:hypothetical protein
MEEEQKDNLPSLADLSRRLHCPVEILEENAEAPEAPPPPPPQTSSTTDDDGHKQQQNKSFPLVSYLDLRRHQNVAWANDRLQEGNELVFCDPAKAERLFQQGLDLVPDHADLLVAYGTVLAQTIKRRPLAILKLNCALEIDPNHVGAKEQLERVQLQHQSLLRRRHERNNVVPVARESSVYQDVLMERSLAALDSLPQKGPEDHEDEDGENHSSEIPPRRKESSRKHHHHHKKHRKKRRKRSRSSSPSSDDDETSSDSSYAKRKKRRKRKRRHDVSSDSSSSSSSSSEDNDDRRRRKRKHRHRRRHHRKHASKRKKEKREKEEHGTKDHDSDPPDNMNVDTNDTHKAGIVN